MLTENKFSKPASPAGRYLLYATGEILLVVIGILIALSINNNNDNKRIADYEKGLLTEMIANLQRDLIDLKFSIRKNKNILKANRIVLDYLEDPSIEADSINFYFANIQGNAVFGKNISAYESLKTVGFRMTENKNLREQITNHYTDTYDYIRYLEQNRDEKYQIEQVVPQINKHIVIDSTGHSAHPVNIDILSQNQEFKEILKFNCQIKTEIIAVYEIIEKQTYDLLNMIDRELEN